MTEIYLMTAEHTYWKETISFAEKYSWKAGPFLARKMLLCGKRQGKNSCISLL